MIRPEALHFPQDLRSKIDKYLPQKQSLEGHEKPYVTLTYAASLDSQIAIAPNTQTAISGQETKAMTHFLRYKHDSIAVGAGTLLADNPSLNCRIDDALSEGLSAQPTPLILDRRGDSEFHKELKVLQLSSQGFGKSPILCLGADAADLWQNDGRLKSAQSNGAKVIAVDSFPDTLKALTGLGIASLMVEGGANVINNILSKHLDLVDAVIVTIAPTYFGHGGVTVRPMRKASNSIEAVARFKDVCWVPMGNDVVMFAKVK